jgi:hypothetical protein
MLGFYRLSGVAAPGERQRRLKQPLCLYSVVSLALASSIALATASGAAAAGDANRPTCSAQTESSPGFRPSLPDCRAYELVTPPQKNGQPPLTGEGAISAAAKIAFFSLGAFDEPGNSATTQGGEYVTNRAASSWSTLPINPSGQQFQGGAFGSDHESIDFNQDLTETLILQPLRTAKPIDYHFYRRSVSDGALVEVGPLSPPATVAAWSPSLNEGSGPGMEYRGASADLSHVFFSLRTLSGEPGALEWTWPGDKTLKASESLYEYAGSSNSEPELVGVRNQTSLAAAATVQHKTHINEAAEQISECGIALGGLNSTTEQTVDAYNAISRAGNAVYFAPIPGGCEGIGSGPSVAEVYVRLDRERTVDISEPSTGPTGDCESCNVSEPLDATFQGASEDGSIAFFISPQKLFAGANGEEGTNLYEFDQNGPAHHKLTFIAPQLSEAGGLPGGVMRVTEPGNFVYFVSKAATLATVPLNSGGQSAQPEEPNLYVRDTASGATTFVGTLSPEDELEWSSEDIRGVEATTDGRFLVFPSVAHLTPDASGVGRQLYRFEAPSPGRPAGELTRASVGASGAYVCGQTHVVESGFNCNGNAGAPTSSVFAAKYDRNEGTAAPGYLTRRLAQPAGVSISTDGSKVFFASPEGLAPGALNEACAREAFGECQVAAENIYEWDNGQIYLLSDGRDSSSLFGSSATRLVGADPVGDNVFMTTTSVLVPQDIDSQVDIYDARAEGGFPPEAASVLCSSTCRSGEAEPSFSTPGSATTLGLGNVQATPPAPVAPPRTVRLTRAQKLRKALKACRQLRRRKRPKCEAAARRRYGPIKAKARSKRAR